MLRRGIVGFVSSALPARRVTIVEPFAPPAAGDHADQASGVEMRWMNAE
jgi:hypothetical protein